MEYLKNAVLAQEIGNAPEFIKSASTMLRIPTSQEVGSDLNTFVKTGAGVRQEAANTISSDCIIARNPQPISDAPLQYNEWIIERPVAIKNYGQEVIDGLSSEFGSYKKINTIKAVELTPEIMNILGVEGDSLNITVSWSPEPMIAKVGDYLTNEGYSISKNDMLATYEPASLSDGVRAFGNLFNSLKSRMDGKEETYSFTLKKPPSGL